MRGEKLPSGILQRRNKIVRPAAAIAVAALLGLASSNARADDSTGMITWSISGSTAMRNFTVGVPGTSVGGLTFYEANSSTLTLSNGSYTVGTVSLQLAPSPYTGTPLAGSTGAGVRVEFHESGSVEGILDLANDQIGYFTTDGGATGGIVDPFTSRNPSGGNPIWLNRSKLSATNASGPTPAGFALAPSNYNTYANYTASGTNMQGGQNRVQMAISDVVPAQGFSTAGAGVFNARPGDPGYGKGNALLNTGTNLAGLGSSGARQQLVDATRLNMEADKINPQTGSGYGAGAWNSGTINNLTTKTVAITATVFAANPGTGLTNLNKTDAQWLQTTGRLKNGVDFNMTERDSNSGTRNVAALNTGVDPSWAVGEDDGGNGYGAGSAGTLECAIGPTMHFSGKTAGGGLLRPTVQNNRMAIGVLGMADAIGATGNTNAGQTNTSANPLRALSYANKTSDDPTLAAADYIQPTTLSITKGDYVIWQKEQYVTVRNPNATEYSNDEVAKGDANGDIVKLRDNVLNSVNAKFPNPATFSDPADQLLANSFLLPQMMLVDKQTDGGATTDVSTLTVNGMTHTQWQQAALNEPTVTKNFNTLPAANVTSGSNSLYGFVSGTTSIGFTGAGGVNVAITAQDASGVATLAPSAPKGNYLFGNFNQNGVRDFSAVMSAQAAQAALDTGTLAAADINVADVTVSNSTKFAGISTALDSMNGGTGPTKGDLIVMGDYNGDGKFDGKDLYIMAHGAAVADARGGTTLTATAANFGDKIRSAVLVKNAALDWMNTHATAVEKVEASANATNDPTGVNAFNKFDVNRDGLVSRSDAQVVDHFVGSDYRNLSDQLGATIATDGTINPAAAQRPISLVDAELNDTGDITNITTNSADKSDFQLVREALGPSLLDGDANFDGTVNTLDFTALATDFNATGQKWSQGDFNFDGVVNALDFNAIATNFGSTAPSPALGSLVPEPGSMMLILAACGFAMPRTSRRRSRPMR